jgi:hypothetical protein
MTHIFQRRRLLLLLIACGISTTANSQSPAIFKYEEPKSLTATIYSLDRKTALFKFSRHLTRSGANLEAIREYTYPDGKLAARERVMYNGDDLQSYELDELQTGGYGHATIKPDPSNPARKVLSFEYSEDSVSRGNPKRSSEPLRNDTLNNDMVGPFLASHWDPLLNGQEVKCRMIVVPRRETVGFRFVKESESQWQGGSAGRGGRAGRAATGPIPIVIIRMEATSPVIRALIDPLHFKIEKQGAHRVLEYSGRTTPKMKSGNKWQDLEAITVFDW